mmetsp:Transcript_1948/g.5075  ORF Transcript_1948/g.5075 Transcript_1948/m.5075 type:complete len:253 (+) Transcript_1948:22-780(+)
MARAVGAEDLEEDGAAAQLGEGRLRRLGAPVALQLAVEVELAGCGQVGVRLDVGEVDGVAVEDVERLGERPGTVAQAEEGEGLLWACGRRVVRLVREHHAAKPLGGVVISHLTRHVQPRVERGFERGDVRGSAMLRPAEGRAPLRLVVRRLHLLKVDDVGELPPQPARTETQGLAAAAQLVDGEQRDGRGEAEAGSAADLTHDLQVVGARAQKSQRARLHTRVALLDDEYAVVRLMAHHCRDHLRPLTHPQQ